jgi:ribonucleoside-diphosphate reductase alpha chain
VSEGAFLPNSPVMMNSEYEIGVNLFACHVLSPPSKTKDFNIAEQIHNGCGGIGYDFSEVESPVSLTHLIEKETEALNPNRKRKAHSAVTLSYKHAQINDFINMGKDLTITHTNVEFDNDFFSAIANGDSHSLGLWDNLCKSIYSTGRPSLSFSSEKNKYSRFKLINNVCGESLLRENESSLIGSLNLTKFILHGVFDFIRFQYVARLGLRCLDNLHDIQDHASLAVKKNCLESRKVGIGIMGYSDALLLLKIRYGSDESLIFIDKLMTLLKSTLVDESEKLGQERGFCNMELLTNKIKPRRNVSLMAIPANGTLSLIANVSGGIEPIFAYLTKQNVQGELVHQLQPTFKKLLKSDNVNDELVFNQLMSGKKMEFIEEINQSLKSILIEANSLTIEEHIFTQAKFQGYIDGGISKTINLPNSATVDDIKNAIMLAKENSCVGISLYRNGSLQGQPTQMVG